MNDFPFDTVGFDLDGTLVDTAPDLCRAVNHALAARGCRLAVVTNKQERFARKLLDELGMTARFACVLGGDTLGPGRSKPSRDMLDEALRMCGGSRFAMVGDSSFDVRAARAAEVPVVVLAIGYHDLPPEELGADALIGHFNELEAALARLEPGPRESN